MGVRRSSQTLFAFLLAAWLPATGHADCFEPFAPPGGGVRGLPATVGQQERRTVEALVGSPVEHIACSRIAPRMGTAEERRAQVVEASLGYFALTDKALFFVRDEPAWIPGRRRQDVFFQASFGEITNLIPHAGPNLGIELVVNERPTTVQVPQGKGGIALFEALRTRVIQACGTRTVLLPGQGVSCPP